MPVDFENMGDEAYYSLIYEELKEAIRPMGWTLLIHPGVPWRAVVKTLGWNYALKVRRWSPPVVEPMNTTKSCLFLLKIIDGILHKNRF